MKIFQRKDAPTETLLQRQRRNGIFPITSAVEKIKAAAAGLDPDEQYELFRWWTESDAFRQRQFAALKRDTATGLADLDNGRYQTHSDANVI